MVYVRTDGKKRAKTKVSSYYSLSLPTRNALSECKFNKMYRLNLPQYEIKITQRQGKPYILDTLRRRYVALTPEEWVEVELRAGDKRLRCDSVLYNTAAQPVMIVEYKAPTVQLTQRVFDQITAYNMLLHVDYLIVSNGLQHYCCRMDYENHTYTFLHDIPEYKNLYKP